MTPPEPTAKFDLSGRLLDTSGTWAWDEETHDWIAADVAAPAVELPAAVPDADDTAAAVAASSAVPEFVTAEPVDTSAVPDAVPDAAPVVVPAAAAPADTDDETAAAAAVDVPAEQPSPADVVAATAAGDQAAPVIVDNVIVPTTPAPVVDPDAEPAVSFKVGDLVDYAVHWPAEVVQTGIVVKVRDEDGACSVAWTSAISGPIPTDELTESQAG